MRLKETKLPFKYDDIDVVAYVYLPQAAVIFMNLSLIMRLWDLRKEISGVQPVKKRWIHLTDIKRGKLWKDLLRRE